MAGFMEFQCDTQGDRNASRLCLNGASCQLFDSLDDNSQNITTTDLIGKEFCVCPPGYVHDFTMGHFMNCGMTDFALAVMFGVLTVLYLIGFVVCLLIHSELKFTARRIVTYCCLEIFVAWWTFLLVWVQNGFYEPAAFFFFLTMGLVNRAMVETTLVLVGPIYSTLHSNIRRLRNLLHGLEGVSLLTHFVLMILMIVFAREANPTRFNSIMVITVFVFGGTAVLMTLCTVISSVRLWFKIDQEIGEHKEDPKIGEFVDRLRQMILSHFAGFFSSLLLLGFPITCFILKSFPGQYIIFFFFFALVPVFCSVATYNFRTDESSQKRKSMALEKKRQSRSKQQHLDELSNRESGASLERGNSTKNYKSVGGGGSGVLMIPFSSSS